VADRLEAAAALLKKAGFSDGAETAIDTVDSVRGIAETFKPKEPAAATPVAWDLISGLVDEVEAAESARVAAEDRAAGLATGCANLVLDAEAARHERDKLQAFKDYVHKRLDDQDVPHHPPGPHGAEGCRIGDRLDWLISRLDAEELAQEGLRTALEFYANERTYDGRGEVPEINCDNGARARAALAGGGRGE
jgi:hypothetical protein